MNHKAVFESADAPESRLLRLNRYLTEGNFYDPGILKGILQAQLGDITFQEAYNRSRLILNITVSSSSLYEMPRLFNYITSPDVVSIIDQLELLCFVLVFNIYVYLGYLVCCVSRVLHWH
jgi:predicted acylesterase/phospholipase RssA